MNREDIVKTILSCLRAVCKMKGIPEKTPFDESTVLIGSDVAILDSLGVVLLLVQVEEALNTSSDTETGLVQRLFSSDVHSETVGSLLDRVLSILGEKR
jgi:hypothetical protein